MGWDGMGLVRLNGMSLFCPGQIPDKLEIFQGRINPITLRNITQD